MKKPIKLIIDKIHCLVFLFLIQSVFVFGQESGIKIPELNDKYSHYVQQLESGKTDIDYADFRNSFLDSKQFWKNTGSYDSLKRQMFAAVKSENYQAVIKLTKAMLSIDYTSLYAHKFLQQTYKILGDTVSQKKYHDIEFGLLYSITTSGDGKTCETGWHVTQIEEEYFVLYVLGLDLQQQSISNSKKNVCDRMDVKTEEGVKKTYYFEANKVFEMEKKMFEK